MTAQYFPLCSDHLTACGDRLVHAVTIAQTFGKAKVGRAEDLVTVCGASVHALYGATIHRCHDEQPGVCAMPWPPPVAAITPRYKRCLACHQDTGSKRPDRMWANLRIQVEVEVA